MSVPDTTRYELLSRLKTQDVASLSQDVVASHASPARHLLSTGHSRQFCWRNLLNKMPHCQRTRLQGRLISDCQAYTRTTLRL